MFRKLFSEKRIRRAEKRARRAAEKRRLNLILERHGVDLFLDIGANVGQTGLGLRDGGYSGRIISVEPVAACHQALSQASADDPLWEIADRCAIGESEGSTEIIVSESTDLSSLSAPTKNLSDTFPKAREQGRETVPLKRIDSLFGDSIRRAERPFLKIDTQGHDLPALKSAQGVMDKLCGVQIEMSLLPLYEGEVYYLEILTFLDRLGFVPHMLVERAFRDDLARQLQIDGIFLRDV